MNESQETQPKPEAGQPLASPACYVASQRVWDQTSADYNAQSRTRTKIVTSQTTVGEIMEWAKYKGLGVGDVTLTEATTE